MSGTWIWLPPSGGSSLYFGDPVANVAALPASGLTGEVRYVIDENAFYVWDGLAWAAVSIAAVIDINTGTTGVLEVAKGGTNSSAALANGKIMASVTGAIVESVVNLDTSGNANTFKTIALRNDDNLTAPILPMIQMINQSDTPTSNPHVELKKTRAAGADLVNGDVIGGIDFHSQQAAASFRTARIHAQYTGDGTTRLADIIFSTANGSNPVEAMRIKASGEVAMNAGAFRLANLTTVQRDALTPATGMLVFNTDTSRFQGYFSGAWSDIHGWGS